MTDRDPRRRGIIHRYRDDLALPGGGDVVTLDEGGTPLVTAPRLARHLGVDVELYLKVEGANPTGSFKDRGMTVAVTAAVAAGARAVICASTGNTSASAAAYAGRAGLGAFVVIPEGRIALGKLSQAIVHGATVVAIDGGFDDALRIVRALDEDPAVAIVNSINPFRIEGQKTAAFEVCDALGRAPDLHFLPVGNAGNITAYWKGYLQWHEAKRIDSLPRMMGVQAAGAAPIVMGEPVSNPETFATAIRIGNPASWQSAIEARDQSDGMITAVTDEQIRHAYRLLASLEGVFVEPASAAGVAGLQSLARLHAIPPGATVVCTLTGHGLKDPTAATDACPPPLHVPADVDAVRTALHL